MELLSDNGTRWLQPNRLRRPQITLAQRHQWAADAAALLGSRGAERVWLFGSLAAGRPQDFRSDIDLAVKGRPPDDYLGALGELLMRLPLEVDLVEIERAPLSLREEILSSGILLYAS